MEEVKFYGDENIMITNKRLILPDNKTYMLSNITSASFETIPVSCILMALLLGAASIGAISFVISFGLSTTINWGLLIFGALLLVGPIIFAIGLSKRRTFALRIGFGVGTEDIIKSRDQEYVKKILKNVNYALTNRG